MPSILIISRSSALLFCCAYSIVFWVPTYWDIINSWTNSGEITNSNFMAGSLALAWITNMSCHWQSRQFNRKNTFFFTMYSGIKSRLGWKRVSFWTDLFSLCFGVLPLHSQRTFLCSSNRYFYTKRIHSKLSNAGLSVSKNRFNMCGNLLLFFGGVFIQVQRGR